MDNSESGSLNIIECGFVFHILLINPLVNDKGQPVTGLAFVLEEVLKND
jgi:hypothetical protein